ncbi:serine/threonine protein kinase [Cyanosarcina cf. burmensis CCALA 770]|nr:serine/threonine protein kinase [Cyanosarcina cf. burmensis CCALA 770]
MVTLYLLHPEQSKPLQQWQFEDASIVRIGRAPDNDVVLADPLVSRHHLLLQRQNGEDSSSHVWQLINQGTNGTFLDGVLVSQSAIVDGSIIQLAKGGPTLRFQFQSPSTRAGEQGGKRAGEKTCNHDGNSPQNLFCIHCGQPLSVQQTIHQYQVLRILGQGGMGTTYLAWNPSQKKPLGNNSTRKSQPQLLVLKEMNAEIAKVAKAQELFEREANALKHLNHVGIPKYYDFFVEDGKKYLAMELIHGQNLEQIIYKYGPVTPAKAIGWMLQACEILDYIHSQEPPLIHRDIKPANLMLRSLDHRIVVLDFGAVKTGGTAFVTRIGAEGYCAPEQERGHPLIQSDLYAIGPTLIFLLTGEAPYKFYRPSSKGYQFQLDSIPTVTPELQAVITRVTETKPSDRYATAKELAIALSECH